MSHRITEMEAARPITIKIRQSRKVFFQLSSAASTASHLPRPNIIEARRAGMDHGVPSCVDYLSGRSG